MHPQARCELSGAVATITMDDGKVNAISPSMLSELNEALDEAQAAGAVVVLAGREGVFSAGFDLGVVLGGGASAPDLLKAGFETALRLLAFPTPVVAACSGHAVAMGMFLLLSADHRIGADGPFRIGANEVSIGMTMTAAAIEMGRQRLAPAAIGRVLANGELLGGWCLSRDDAALTR